MQLLQTKTNRYAVYDDEGQLLIMTSYKNIARKVLEQGHTQPVKDQSEP